MLLGRSPHMIFGMIYLNEMSLTDTPEALLFAQSLEGLGPTFDALGLNLYKPQPVLSGSPCGRRCL